MAMASRKERIKRVVAGYKADPKRFKGTRTEETAAEYSSGAAQNSKRSADATNIAERQRQERVVGIRRGRK